MYRYDSYDHTIVNERVAQFTDQIQRRLANQLSEEEFLPLRLQNGLYMQRHAYMLRVAVPYGLLSSKQLRMLAHIAQKYDKDYAHFSTRQNLQYNWIKLETAPELFQDLASVEMHGIQTSGNCIRNITTDAFAGVAADELVDPRPLAEILRQWSTFHPEFAYLPRKFKIAINGAQNDRAVVSAHDIGLHVIHNAAGELGVRVLVGGGMGRTPVIGSTVREFLPMAETLNYLEAIMRVYNLHGRRDNKYKARIKILLRALGAKEFTQQVDAEWVAGRSERNLITDTEWQRVSAYFQAPPYRTAIAPVVFPDDAQFKRWYARNTRAHKVSGYRSVVLSLKPHGVAPGDASSAQMRAVADLADQYSFGEIRVTHEQNLVLADVCDKDLYLLWQALKEHQLAMPNVGLLTDLICCPGGDFCSLANAKSLPIAAAIQTRFDDLDYLHDIGDLELNISGCINSCGHHHVGHIGILGVDKDGSEFYQISIGGQQGKDARFGKILGPSFSAEEVPDMIEKIISVYLSLRYENERFVDATERIGIAPFKTALYGA